MKALELKRELEQGGCADPFWILGPCVLEDDTTVHIIAEKLSELRQKHGFRIVFKASFDKANRTSGASKRGPGIEEGLERLRVLRGKYGFPVLTDIHETTQASAAAEVVDILQIPAFLSRQTDLIAAAVQTGRAVNVKKGQFFAPENVRQLMDKLTSFGSQAHWITERGVSFGYQRLVVDFAGFHVMKRAGADLIFDLTHSVQLPGGAGEVTGGVRDAIPDLARAAAAVGVRGFFAEVHPEPARAWSDAANAWPLDQLEALMIDVRNVAQAAHGKGSKATQ